MPCLRLRKGKKFDGWIEINNENTIIEDRDVVVADGGDPNAALGHDLSYQFFRRNPEFGLQIGHRYANGINTFKILSYATSYRVMQPHIVEGPPEARRVRWGRISQRRGRVYRPTHPFKLPMNPIYSAPLPLP